MTDIKKTCEHEGKRGNFCNNCGGNLREKCPECGEMEKIGRKVCETRIRVIKKDLKSFENKAPDYFMLLLKYPVASSILAFISAIIWVAQISSQDPIVLGISGLAMLFFTAGTAVLFPLSYVLTKRQREKIEKQFFELHPDYKHLLKQAESGC